MIFVFADSLNFLSAQNVNSIVLTWTDNSFDEDGFYIERAVGSGIFSQIYSVGSDVQQYADYDVQQDVTYRYRVKAYNSQGNSHYSNTVQITFTSSQSGGSSTGSSVAGSGGVGGGASGVSGGLTGSAISLPNESFGSDNSSKDNSNINGKTISGQAINGDLGSLIEPSTIIFYVCVAVFIFAVLFAVLRNSIQRD